MTSLYDLVVLFLEQLQTCEEWSQLASQTMTRNFLPHQNNVLRREAVATLEKLLRMVSNELQTASNNVVDSDWFRIRHCLQTYRKSPEKVSLDNFLAILRRELAKMTREQFVDPRVASFLNAESAIDLLGKEDAFASGILSGLFNFKWLREDTSTQTQIPAEMHPWFVLEWDKYEDAAVRGVDVHVEAARVEAERAEAVRVEAVRVEAVRVEAVRVEAERAEAERKRTEELVMKEMGREFVNNSTPESFFAMLNTSTPSEALAALCENPSSAIVRDMTRTIGNGAQRMFISGSFESFASMSSDDIGGITKFVEFFDKSSPIRLLLACLLTQARMNFIEIFAQSLHKLRCPNEIGNLCLNGINTHDTFDFVCEGNRTNIKTAHIRCNWIFGILGRDTDNAADAVQTVWADKSGRVGVSLDVVICKNGKVSLLLESESNGANDDFVFSMELPPTIIHRPRVFDAFGDNGERSTSVVPVHSERQILLTQMYARARQFR